VPFRDRNAKAAFPIIAIFRGSDTW